MKLAGCHVALHLCLLLLVCLLLRLLVCLLLLTAAAGTGASGWLHKEERVREAVVRQGWRGLRAGSACRIRQVGQAGSRDQKRPATSWQSAKQLQPTPLQNRWLTQPDLAAAPCPVLPPRRCISPAPNLCPASPLPRFRRWLAPASTHVPAHVGAHLAPPPLEAAPPPTAGTHSRGTEPAQPAVQGQYRGSACAWQGCAVPAAVMPWQPSWPFTGRGLHQACPPNGHWPSTHPPHITPPAHPAHCRACMFHLGPARSPRPTSPTVP